MEIRNIYEDSYGDKRIYSILLDEDELRLFSERSKAGWKGAWKGFKKGALYGLGAAGVAGVPALISKNTRPEGVGLLSTGAIVGGIYGAKLGYEKATKSWEKEQLTKQLIEQIRKEQQPEVQCQNTKKLLNEINYRDWDSLSKTVSVPQMVLNYVKFYETVWSKKGDSWYKGVKVDQANPVIYDVFKKSYYISGDGNWKFTDLFPPPLSIKEVKLGLSKSRKKELPICVLQDDRSFIKYDLNEKEYFICPVMDDYTTKSLGELLCEYIDSWFFSGNSTSIKCTPNQLRLIQEYKQYLKKYSIL